jgi:hypothetical protein
MGLSWIAIGSHYASGVPNRGTLQHRKESPKGGRNGSYRAERDVDDRPDSLNTNDPTSARQQSVAEVPEEVITSLAREIVRQAGLQREVPEEILQVLAREIVEQAGLKRDPEIEALRQNMRDTGETFKHLNMISGAAAAGVVVIEGALGVEGSLAVVAHRALGLGALGLSVENSIAAVSLLFIGISFLLSLVGLLGTTLWLTRARELAVRRYPVNLSRWLVVLTNISLFSGVAVFVVNAISGL